ncbi:MAG TPA: hypothetical protein VF503_11655 [Sphingobium sp.]|uniref:hypothetical protein n=1 Tax=Sphingobium sp. TaxID=1912891 RepID=UPI002ED0BB7D
MRSRTGKMIDNFSLLLTHSLILIACWRLLSRPDLDTDTPEEPRGFLKNIRHRGAKPEDIGDA